jgi:hypothetical protein
MIVMRGLGRLRLFSTPSTISAAPAFVLFESWAPLTLPFGMFPAASTVRLGERKSVAQTPVVPSFPTEGKLGQPQFSVVTAKLGQPPREMPSLVAYLLRCAARDLASSIVVPSLRWIEKRLSALKTLFCFGPPSRGQRYGVPSPHSQTLKRTSATSNLLMMRHYTKRFRAHGEFPRLN